MTQVTDQTAAQPLSDTDLAAEVQRVIGSSSEPLTISKIRSSLPTRMRSVTLEALGDVLRRQVAAMPEDHPAILGRSHGLQLSPRLHAFPALPDFLRVAVPLQFLRVRLELLQRPVFDS